MAFLFIKIRLQNAHGLLSPAECLFIDDQFINVQAAQAAGMSAFVFYSQDRPGIISSLQSYNIIDRAE
jgi:beta-phosphoglucomutase-like phosphatase (HAD superfamily)